MNDTSGGDDPPDINSDLNTTKLWLNAMDVVGSNSWQFENVTSYDGNLPNVNMVQLPGKRPFTDNMYEGNITDVNKVTSVNVNKVRVLNISEMPVPGTSMRGTPAPEKNVPGVPALGVPASGLPAPEIPQTTTSHIANSYKSAFEINKNNRYDISDSGPFIIILESINKNIGKLHKLSIGKLIFGSFNFEYNTINDILISGKNRIKVVLSNMDAANKILNSPDFLNKNNLQGYIPATVLFRKGVIHNVDPDITSEEMKANINSPVIITDVRRIFKKVTQNNENILVPSETVVLTFRGQNLPDYVSIYGARCKVSPYIYRVIQCLNCCRFGHTTNQCRSHIRCNKCSENHDPTICIAKPVCGSCEGNHKTTDRLCPEFKNQLQIKKYMAFNNVSYREAKLKYKTYAEVVTFNNKDFPTFSTNNRFNILQNFPDKEEQFDQRINYGNLFSKPRRNFKKHITQASSDISSVTNSDRYSRIPDRTRNDHPSSSKPIIAQNPYHPQPHFSPNQSNNVLSDANVLNKLYTFIIQIISKISSGLTVDESHIKNSLTDLISGKQ